MPTAEERIRELRFPPGMAWGDKGPRTQTLRQDIARWYEPAGGLDAAVSSAMEAQGARRKNDTMPEFPFWEASSLDRELPVVIKDLPAKYRGAYDMKTGRVEMPAAALTDPFNRQQTLEHERSHGVFGGDFLHPGYQDSLTPAREDASAMAKWKAYAVRPEELDVRLAMIKRIYAYNTGRLVETPEEAERAVQWYIQNFRDLPADHPDSPNGDSKDAQAIMGLPDAKRAKAMRRMTEVVGGAYRGGDA